MEAKSVVAFTASRRFVCLRALVLSTLHLWTVLWLSVDASDRRFKLFWTKAQSGSSIKSLRSSPC